MTTRTEVAPSFSGIYGIPEVAQYLAVSPPLTNWDSVPTAKLRYWIRTSVPAIAPSPYPTRQKLITFLDLVSMRMVAILRSKGIELSEIRLSLKYLKKQFGLEYPFATEPLWTYGSDVFIEFRDNLLAVSRYGQQTMAFLRGWLTEVERDMTFDSHQLADSWIPYRGIRFDPKIQFGEPCLEGTRITTRTIWSNITAGDSPENVAELYEITPAQVLSAVEWERRLDTTRSSHIHAIRN